MFLCPSDAVTVNEKGVNGQSVVNTTIVQCLTVVTFIAYEKKKKNKDKASGTPRGRQPKAANTSTVLPVSLTRDNFLVARDS